MTPPNAVWAIATGLATIAGVATALAADAPRLSLPIACEPGRTCFVQNHVDLDPGPGARDFACETATYDGHKGVDFRVVSAATAAARVTVVAAAAPGTVKGVRDGMADQFAREAGGVSFAGRECGNGVVIDHGGGWETQYCHMQRGSVVVRSGQTVARGERLGAVGYSGFADFAHLHFAVRRGDAVIDPYSGQGLGSACARDVGSVAGLWDDAAARVLPYRRGEFIESGFAAAIPSTMELEHGGARVAAPGPEGSGLVFFARVMNARPGDRIRLRATGPGGFIAEVTSAPFDRGKAVAVQAVGRKRSLPRWVAGSYEGVADLLRGGEVVATMRAGFEMP